MTDCVFYVADANMRAAVHAFLTRHEFHHKLGCRLFRFEIFVDYRRDPGVFNNGHEFLGNARGSYQYAVLMLDCAWDGSPGQAQIKQQLSARVEASGWNNNNYLVVAIEPELEAWIWQDSPHVEAPLRHGGRTSLRKQLEVQGHWPPGVSKPPRPKEALEVVLRQRRMPRSSAIYEAIVSKIGVGKCVDSEFQALRTKLRAWFPA